MRTQPKTNRLWFRWCAFCAFGFCCVLASFSPTIFAIVIFLLNFFSFFFALFCFRLNCVFVVQSRKVTLYKFSSNNITFKCALCIVCGAYFQAQAFYDQNDKHEKALLWYSSLVFAFSTDFRVYNAFSIHFSYLSFCPSHSRSLSDCVHCICVIPNYFEIKSIKQSAKNAFFVVKCLRLLNAFKSGFRIKNEYKEPNGK